VDDNKSWAAKLMWMLLIIFGTGLAAYQVHNRIAYYVQTPTAANIDIKNHAEINFPQVTLCNENTMSRSVATYLGQYVHACRLL
jgi:hypothetical protein